MAETPRAQKYQITVRIRQLDENDQDIRQPLEVNKTIDCALHRSTDHRVQENDTAFAWLDTGAVAGSITTPSLVAVYSPDAVVRFAIGTNDDLTIDGTDAESAPGFDRYRATAPSGHLLIVADLDGGDTGFDKLDLRNDAAAGTDGNENDAHPTVWVSGD